MFGPAGVRYLADGRVEEDDPLARFGPHTAADLRRHDAVSRCVGVRRIPLPPEVMTAAVACLPPGVRWMQSSGARSSLRGVQTDTPSPGPSAEGTSDHGTEAFRHKVASVEIDHL